jgi:hypothetical protein
LIFGYEYHQNVGPRNEKYSINFTGPGSITVDPHFDNNAGQYLGGIYVVKQDSSGAYAALGGGDFFTPIGYDNLWDLGILQANGQSGLTGATFSNYFTTTGDKFHENYTLTSLLTAGLPGDYNGDHKVDAADYVLWRKSPTTYGGNPAGYNTWRASFGNTGPGSGSLSSGTVPEPAAFMLVALGLVGFWMAPQRFDR